MSEYDFDLALLDSTPSWYNFEGSEYVVAYLQGISQGDVVPDDSFYIGDSVLPRQLVNGRQIFKVIRGKDNSHPTERVALVTDTGLVQRVLEEDFNNLMSNDQTLEAMEDFAKDNFPEEEEATQRGN